MIIVLCFFIAFICKPQQHIEPIYCTNTNEYIHEDITKYNVTRSKSTLEKLLVMKRKNRIAKYSGFDDRNITEDASLDRINEHIRKYELLKLLQNGAIGETQKLEAIEIWRKMDGESPMAPDLTHGGLFRDWDWDF